MSEEVRAHLDEMIGSMEAHALHRRTIDWSALRAEVSAAAAGAQTIPEAYGAITIALSLLRDRGHSRYQTPQGESIRAPAPLGVTCLAPAAARPEVPVDVGYLRVGASAGTGAVAFAQALHDSIRANDRPDLRGWIVDLRGNTGGNMWAMLAGVGPVLGDGIVGRFISPTGVTESWAYASGSSFRAGQAVVTVAEPYELRRRAPRVAVLTDGRVASAGEAVALAFRGRADTRSFGAPTCGVATGVASIPLSADAVLYLTVSWMADRAGTIFPEVIFPDEALPEPEAVVQRAVAWLHEAVHP